MVILQNKPTLIALELNVCCGYNFTADGVSKSKVIPFITKDHLHLMEEYVNNFL